MTAKTTGCLAILLIPLAGNAGPPIRLSDHDIYFQTAGIAVEGSHTGTNVSRPSKASSNRLCGFSIRGNHRSRANPHPEWDLNIDEIVSPGRTIAGVSAGAFNVDGHKRTPQPPIAHLSFKLTGSDEPIVAGIQGAPNADNGVIALIEAEPASRLFAEFQTLHPIVISLEFSDGNTTALEVRGFRDDSKFGGGKNSYFEKCLRGFRTALGGEITTTMP